MRKIGGGYEGKSRIQWQSKAKQSKNKSKTKQKQNYTEPRALTHGFCRCCIGLSAFSRSCSGTKSNPPSMSDKDGGMTHAQVLQQEIGNKAAGKIQKWWRRHLKVPPVPPQQEGPRVPPHFICPISLQVFYDPVIARDGITYERSWISEWFKTHRTSPAGGHNRLANLELVPNLSLKSVIAMWCKDNNMPVPTSAPELPGQEQQAAVRLDGPLTWLREIVDGFVAQAAEAADAPVNAPDGWHLLHLFKDVSFLREVKKEGLRALVMALREGDRQPLASSLTVDRWVSRVRRIH